VRLGDSNLAIHPDGAIRKTNPNAAAACGTDKSGDNRRSSTRKARVPDQLAAISATISNDKAVAIRPTHSDRRVAAPSPCQSSNVRKGSSDGPLRPAAGRCPNAGRTVPHRPAMTGPNIASNVSAGRRRSIVAYWPVP